MLLDENGEIHIEVGDLVPDMDDPDVTQKYDQLYKAVMRALTKTIWKDQDMKASRAIRVLSMSEMACDRQPYEHVDQFFFAMMDHFLPQYEEYCNHLKVPYGFNPGEMIKPFTMKDFSCMQLSGNPFLNENMLN